MTINWSRVGKSVAAVTAQVAMISWAAMSIAHATLLEGNQITTTFYYPSIGTIGFGGVPITVTVGPGTEITGQPPSFPITTISFSDTSITLDFTTTNTGSVAAFNGWVFSDSPGTVVPFTGATIVTSLTGWQVTFAANDIYLNGSGARPCGRI
jgi:hypothetical protein